MNLFILLKLIYSYSYSITLKYIYIKYLENPETKQGYNL